MAEFVEIRCPSCNKRIADGQDLDGDLSFYCRRCRTAWGNGSPEDLPRMECRCGRLLAHGRVTIGILRMVCRTDHRIVEMTPSGTTETPQGRKLIYTRRLEDQLDAFIRDRFDLLAKRDAVQRAELAVGVRFKVFARDGFQCTYCGRSPARDGVRLEADHVIPRAAGGTDVMENLTTSCRDCNRGKSDTRLDVAAANV